MKKFVLENDINILCIQEAEVKANDNKELIRIQGFSMEVEKTSENFTKRSVAAAMVVSSRGGLW